MAGHAFSPRRIMRQRHKPLICQADPTPEMQDLAGVGRQLACGVIHRIVGSGSGTICLCLQDSEGEDRGLLPTRLA